MKSINYFTMSSGKEQQITMNCGYEKYNFSMGPMIKNRKEP
jgi:hypothetical protein